MRSRPRRDCSSSPLSTGVFTDGCRRRLSIARLSSVDKQLRKLIVMAEVREPRTIDIFARKSINVFRDRSSNPDATLARRRCFDCAIILYLVDYRDFRCIASSDLLYVNYVYQLRNRSILTKFNYALILRMS